MTLPPDPDQPTTSKRVSAGTQTGSVARSTVIVMAGMLGAMAFGLIRQRVIALSFGTGYDLDAYTAANGLPELLFTMLSGGALAFAFIPVYTRHLSDQGREASNQLFSQVVNSILLLSLGAALLGAHFAPTLVSAPWGVGPNFPPEVQRLTASLMRVLLLSTVIFAMSSLLTGTLHAHQHFLVPAITPIMYSSGIIAGALFLAPEMGIFGLAWGAVLGSGLHLAIQVPVLLRFGVGWRPTLGWGSPGLRRVAVLMAPRVIDLMMARASIDWINANLGSGLGVGRVSSLRYAFQLMNMPWTLIGTAIGIAVFPTMAVLAARRDVSAQRRALSGSLRAILTLTFPAAVGLLLLGRPIIRLLFEGGEFTAQSTELVYYALQFYVVALISQSMLEVVVRAFAAQEDTLTPLLVSLFTTALNLGLAILLSRPRAQGGLEHGGLALANGVAVGAEALIGLTILHFRWEGIGARRILRDTTRALISAGVMGAVLWLSLNQFQWGTALTVLLGGAIGVTVYFGMALLLGMEEVRTIPAALLGRATRRW